jgi:ParB family transcriptional regulator, chromosome partitioning protein
VQPARQPAEQTEPYYTTHAIRARLANQPTTPKAATMLALACVITAWEESTNLHTWRHPGPWDARIMTALTGWGYAPSDVETLLINGTGPRADGAADLAG